VKFGLISLFCLTLLTCRSIDTADWPASLPSQDYFVEAYEADAVNQELQSRQEYLQWILSFYDGTVVAPTGWEAMQSMVVQNAAPEQRSKLNAQLFELGGQIAAEWAKENSGRAIDSRMLSIWGSVLQLVVGPEQLYAAIQLIRADAEGLLNRDLLGDEINDARYEERLGLRLFGDF